MLTTSVSPPTTLQDFSARGPFVSGSLSQKVKITTPSPTSKSGTLVDLDVIVTYPNSSAAAPFPIVVMFNGFQAKATWYTPTANHVTSWGYVVLQYTIPGLLPIVVDRVELGYLTPLLDWLRTQANTKTSRLYGLPDFTRLATMGHSRGGKLAALHYAGRTDIATAVLVDPIDNTIYTSESPDYPSAAKALLAANRTAGLIGGGVISSCNPAGSNYPKFFSALAPGSWQMVVVQAGHIQFASGDGSLSYWGADKLCTHGSITTSEVVNDTNLFAVAWLQSTFRKQQSQTGLAAFQQWVNVQTNARALNFTVKASTTMKTL
ncbi:hypothetical protein Vretimale_3104 [Volvox reticuliferus]|uniref:Chlorophyllase n=1 Tax=Volvox reticuliferus TaxID=1737510 RepID=A0A8J4C7X6_9CHLO|nr:hypothetical protein Vretifemale_6710 [Volvox reticuliferus]GIL97460.1 hypothetical protein Vretimale_3104 [Volvox reticuliferus]